jgi:Xaa-Pro aminopeptidase
MSDLRVSKATYEQRFAAIQQFLADEGLGGLLAYSPPMEHKWGQTGHVSFLSGWADHDRLADSVVVVPAQGRPALLFAGLPFMRDLVLEHSPLDDVRLVQAVDPNAVAVDPKAGPAPDSFGGQARAVLRDRGVTEPSIGVVGVENMPFPFHQALAAQLGDDLRHVDDIVADLRSTKSPDELDLMRHAARLSDLGFETMLATAKPGYRGIEVVAEMERVIRRQGADHAKYWMASGPPPDWENVRLELKPHLRTLQRGDLMSACSYVCYRGYWCHGHRAGVLQEPCPKLEQMMKIGREVQDAGLAVMRAGNPVGLMSRTIRERAAAHGWQIEGGRIGHGMGLDYAERPNMTESNDALLQPGTTGVVHTAFALPGSGKMFVPLGDVCHVTADGPELLMGFPREPFVAGA